MQSPMKVHSGARSKVIVKIITYRMLFLHGFIKNGVGKKAFFISLVNKISVLPNMTFSPSLFKVENIKMISFWFFCSLLMIGILLWSTNINLFQLYSILYSDLYEHSFPLKAIKKVQSARNSKSEILFEREGTQSLRSVVDSMNPGKSTIAYSSFS